MIARRQAVASILAIPALATSSAALATATSDELMVKDAIYHLYSAVNSADWPAVAGAFSEAKDVYWRPNGETLGRDALVGDLRSDRKFGKKFVLQDGLNSVWLPNTWSAIAIVNPWGDPLAMGSPDVHVFRFEFPVQGKPPVFTRFRILESL